MPTPIAFFRILALSRTSIRSGRTPSVSAARAVQSATAIGSVHPMAGTTSRFIRATIRARSSRGIAGDSIKIPVRFGKQMTTAHFPHSGRPLPGPDGPDRQTPPETAVVGTAEYPIAKQR